MQSKKPQKQQALEMLQRAGKRGVFNHDLMKIGYQYPVLIHTLRKEGYRIEREHVTGQTYRFTLMPKEPVQERMFDMPTLPQVYR